MDGGMTREELCEAVHRASPATEIMVDYGRFMEVRQALAAIAPELALHEATTFDLRLRFWGCSFVLPVGNWDDHALSLRAAGWVQ